MSADRRTVFREFIRRLDPAARPQDALAQGFYVAPSGSISERIASRLELEPTSTHMLIGGIGSGKTTQLLRVQERLRQVGDVGALFVDVLERQRREHLDKKGVLLALAGLELCNACAASPVAGSDELEAVQKRIKSMVQGAWLEPWEYEAPGPEDHDMVWQSGIIEPPEKEDHLKELKQAVGTLVHALPFRPVLLFDGLDRLAEIATFATMVSQDVPMLKQAGIGVVVVAPQHARTWQQGSLHDWFDEFHLHGAAQVSSDSGRDFLVAVLDARTRDTGLLEKTPCVALARLSGGLVRDLLALARAAAEEAYRQGADQILDEHVIAAGDQFGRNLLAGIDQEMVNRLKQLAPKRQFFQPPVSFTAATETDIMLLLRRLVIEVPTTPVHYILHPTIAPLIAGLGRRA